MTRGRLITFEGIDGSGKSTQIARLEAFLKERGISVVLTREPGGTELGEKIRSLLLNDEMGVETEMLLFFAARTEHMTRVILPALEKGIWVLSDRFTDATYAYQVGGKAFSAERCEALERWTLGEFKPDCTLLFDIPPEVAAERMGLRAGASDRFERESRDFFRRVREAYLAREQKDPARFLTLDATKTADELTAQIREVFSEWL